MRGLPAMARPLSAIGGESERTELALDLFRYWIGVAAWETSQSTVGTERDLEALYSKVHQSLLMPVQELEFRLGPTIALARHIIGSGDFESQFNESINRTNAYVRGASEFDHPKDPDGNRSPEVNRITTQLDDAIENDLGRDREAMAAQPLWPKLPPELRRRLGEFWDQISHGGNFDFWQRWYQGILDGSPLNESLQREIASIPEHIWEAGPEAVAARITEIEARFALSARISELEPDLFNAAGNRHGIGGNNPPEAIDVVKARPKELLIIWQPLEILAAQVDARNPDPELVKAALSALSLALRTGLQWCAKKADLAVDTAIKWAVPAVGGGYFALNPDKLAAVIEAGTAWLSALP